MPNPISFRTFEQQRQFGQLKAWIQTGHLAPGSLPGGIFYPTIRILSRRPPRGLVSALPTSTLVTPPYINRGQKILNHVSDGIFMKAIPILLILELLSDGPHLSQGMEPPR